MGATDMRHSRTLGVSSSGLTCAKPCRQKPKCLTSFVAVCARTRWRDCAPRPRHLRCVCDPRTIATYAKPKLLSPPGTASKAREVCRAKGTRHSQRVSGEPAYTSDLPMNSTCRSDLHARRNWSTCTTHMFFCMRIATARTRYKT